MIDQARRPRAIILLNGQQVDGWESWEVESNTYYQADTARVAFAASALPAAFGPAWFDAQDRIEIEILVGFLPDPALSKRAEFDSLFFGRVDDVDYDPVAAEIEISARDFSADFIDAKTTEKWQNQTPGEIARTLAERRGLTPAIKDPGGLAGNYYQIDHAKLNSQRTEWDLLTHLAHETGSRVFVRGKSLHFEPTPDEANMPVYQIRWEHPSEETGHSSANVKRLEFSRSLTVAKDVIVFVKSWNAKTKSTTEAVAKRSKQQGGIAEVSIKAGKGNITTGDAQVYRFVFPGLTQEQALQKAQELRRKISSHERKLSAELPGDNDLTIDHAIEVTGTKTTADQRYFPSSIVRRMNIRDGYSMSVSAKNHSPESEVAI